MAKVPPDYSLQREGVPLKEWLWRLLSDDRDERQHAGEVLQSMQYGVPTPGTHLEHIEPFPDMKAQMQRFNTGVREAAAASDFDAAEFVRKLCVYRVSLSNDWSRRVSEASKERKPGEAKWERIAEALVKRLDSGDEQTRKIAQERMTRALCASFERDCKIDKKMQAGAEGMTTASFMSYVIFEALDSAFLAAPEALQFVLDQRRQAHDALKALARIGPPAIAFAPQLIERIDALSTFDAAHALGSIGRDDPATVDALIARLTHASPLVRSAAADALSHMGTAVAGRSADILPLLHAILDRPADNELLATIPALASVGRDDAAARKRIIDLARPRPPRMVTPKDYPYEYDAVMQERGIAIDAMRHFFDYPDECVPVLIDAVDTFEEYDPDECYDGPAGRVASALEAFGPAAAAAAMPLAAKMNAPDEDSPKAILRALGAIGPRAAGALPQVIEYRDRLQPEVPSDAITSEPDREDDLAGWVIRRLRS